MDIEDVVYKIIGEIKPVGETYIDNKRFISLEIMCELVQKIISDMVEVAEDKNNHAFSISNSGKRSFDFLKRIKEQIETLISNYDD
jgi:hypothetical protein